jgi:hypothetical protein
MALVTSTAGFDGAALAMPWAKAGPEQAKLILAQMKSAAAHLFLLMTISPWVVK